MEPVFLGVFRYASYFKRPQRNPNKHIQLIHFHDPVSVTCIDLIDMTALI